MNTTNTANVSAEKIARLMLGSVGFPNDEGIKKEYNDDYYETTNEFIESLCGRIQPFTDSDDDSTLDTRSYVEPYINQVLFDEKVEW